jgi:hypothetical protein
MNLFFSLESIHRHTRKTKDQARVARKNRTLCYEYKMQFLWKRHMFFMQQCNVGGIPLG